MVIDFLDVEEINTFLVAHFTPVDVVGIMKECLHYKGPAKGNDKVNFEKIYFIIFLIGYNLCTHATPYIPTIACISTLFSYYL